MFKKRKILKYKSMIDSYPNTITTAKDQIPEWYKKIPKWGQGKTFTIEDGLQPTVKQCFPFLGSLTTGYTINLPYDIYVAEINGEPYITWPGGVFNSIRARTKIADKNLVPIGHYETEYTWNHNTYYTIPKGYSLLFTHPLNRHDLPFTTLSAVIDGGFVMYAHGNVPFYIKKGFEGVIPQGTPIAQLIPFRQEKWKSEKSDEIQKIGDIHNSASGIVFSGFYKKNFWKRQDFI